jgi:glyoxylase-like metal-dependent hydrolase (beta-lactamase superfamily II)
MEDTNWPDALPRAGNLMLPQIAGLSEWFETYQVGPGTWALLEPQHYEEVISYLILGDERGVLFDTGMGIADIKAEVELLTNLPVVVVNSHSHYDHVGDNWRFDEVWAFDDESEVSRIEAGLGHAECTEFMPPGSYLELPPDFGLATYEIRPSRVTRRLRHLETIELGGRVLTVHHTPGHSPGSICLLDSRDGILFTGDTFYPGTLYAHLEESDFDVYRRSLEYLGELLGSVSHLCPAHNEAYVDKHVLIQAQDALSNISTGQAPFELEGEIRLYRFEGFAVALPDNPGQG